MKKRYSKFRYEALNITVEAVSWSQFNHSQFSSLLSCISLSFQKAITNQSSCMKYSLKAEKNKHLWLYTTQIVATNLSAHFRNVILYIHSCIMTGFKLTFQKCIVKIFCRKIGLVNRDALIRTLKEWIQYLISGSSLVKGDFQRGPDYWLTR